MPVHLLMIGKYSYGGGGMLKVGWQSLGAVQLFEQVEQILPGELLDACRGKNDGHGKIYHPAQRLKIVNRLRTRHHQQVPRLEL